MVSNRCPKEELEIHHFRVLPSYSWSRSFLTFVLYLLQDGLRELVVVCWGYILSKLSSKISFLVVFDAQVMFLVVSPPVPFLDLHWAFTFHFTVFYPVLATFSVIFL